MRSLKRVFCCLLLILSIIASGCSSEIKGGSDTDFKFIVAADPQLFWGDNVDNWRLTIEQINKIDPDLVIVCGDLTESPGNKKQIDVYTEMSKKLKATIKLYNVPGNHDVGTIPSLESLAAYKENIGPLYYSFTHNDNLFIILESSSIKSPTEKTQEYVDEQMKWLREVLSDSKSKNFTYKFVVMHHPIILESLDEQEQYFNMPHELRKELLSLFIDGGINIVFSGHLHQDRVVKFDDIELVVNGSCGKALGQSSLGFRVVNVCPDGLSHEYITLQDQSLRYAD